MAAPGSGAFLILFLVIDDPGDGGRSGRADLRGAAGRIRDADFAVETGIGFDFLIRVHYNNSTIPERVKEPVNMQRNASTAKSAASANAEK